MTLFTAQNNTFDYEVNMSYITFLLLFFNSFFSSKQLHSAKVFNNQQFNLLHFIHNTYHFYTLFTFIIHKIQLFTIQQPRLAYFCRKRAVQILSKKIFSGLHRPVLKLVPRLPPHPLNIYNSLNINKLQHRIDRHRAEYTLKNRFVKIFYYDFYISR